LIANYQGVLSIKKNLMNPALLIFSIGLFFIIVFGGLSLLRREGLSNQFAYEVLGLTSLTSLASYLTGIPVNPLLFLATIYLISMRCRIITDLANLLSNQGRQRYAINLLQFALKIYPDRSTYMVILVNMGIVQIRRKNPQSAIELFKTVLDKAENGGLGIKFEAACRYNLGVALRQLGREPEAVEQFNEVNSILPSSIYSRAAETALEARWHKRDKKEDERNNDAKD
jgi:tetratricopeptide (TPR) repeat protein